MSVIPLRVYIAVTPLGEDTIFRTIQCSRRLFKVQFPDKKMRFLPSSFLHAYYQETESEARKSREADMLSDNKNLDIMLGSNQLEREESEFSN